MAVELSELKLKMLKLLREDEEFRYAVAGLIGLGEVLRRLDEYGGRMVKLEERMLKVEEELVKLREDMNRAFERHDGEMAKLREDMNKLREDMNRGFERYDKEIARLREDMIKGFERYDREMAKLREDMIEGFKRHDEEMARLREDFNRIFQAIDRRLTRVERTLEKLTVDVEDEARSIIKHRLKTELGLDIELSSLILPEVEVNIYGVAKDVCVVGEATVRGGIGVLHSLLEKIELLKSKYPDKLRTKTIMVIYTSLALPELIDEARKKGIWVLKAAEDYYKPTLTI